MGHTETTSGAVLPTGPKSSDERCTRASNPIFVTALRWMLFVAVGLNGCISRATYPASWPKQVRQAADRCEPIRGSFENVGSWAVSHEMDERLLAGLFFPLGSGDPISAHQARRDVTHVTFSDGEEGNLMVTGWIGREPRFERLLTPADLACDRGKWVFRDATWEVEGAVGAAARVSSRYQIAIVEDGSLIMEQRELGAGVLFMILPIGTKATTWLRFVPARAGT
jgi:hypothetical protein